MPTVINIAKTLKKIEIFTNRKVDEVFAGNYRSSFKGRGLEVDDLRRYEDGDDAKHIDWITTAKTGVPYVKKYKETRELTTIILVDLSAAMNFGTIDKQKKEVVIELAATILFSSLKNNDKFGAIAFVGSQASFIPPRKGRRHLLRILKDILSGFENNRNQDSDLNKALSTLMAAIKKSAICFIISDRIEQKNAKLLGVAGRKHDLVFLKVNDHFEFGVVIKEQIIAADPHSNEQAIIDLTSQKTAAEYKRLRSGRYEQEERLLREKRIDHLLILTDANIYKELIMFFKKRQARP